MSKLFSGFQRGGIFQIVTVLNQKGPLKFFCFRKASLGGSGLIKRYKLAFMFWQAGLLSKGFVVSCESVFIIYDIWIYPVVTPGILVAK